MYFYQLTIKNMSMQLQSTSTVLSVSLEKTALLTAIKSEPPESEIGIDDIPNSLEEEIIPDFKDIDILSHVLTEDLIKSETVFENTHENYHSRSVKTQIYVKTENIPLIKTESITQSEYLYKTQDTSDGNVSRGTSQGVIKVEDSNEHSLQSNKQFVNFFKDLSNSRKAKCPTDFSEFHKTVVTSSCEKDRKKEKVVEVPVISIEPHKYISLAKAKCNKNKSTHKQNKKRYNCEKCTYTCETSTHFKIHQLTHKTKAEIDDRLFKYRCDKCIYKTYYSSCLKRHKLTHLKPEETHYFYCYHCSYKSKHKVSVQRHIFCHFKNEDVPFHCYICDFTTLKRNLIIEHFKNHPKHDSKCNEIDYKNQLEIPYFYCYHCSHKSKRKDTLRTHIFKHFERGEIPFHCYICDFVTLERGLIIEHFKKHPKHHSKCDETDYKNQLETFTIKQISSFGKKKKYRCDKCKYKTFRHHNFKTHKLIHLKPEEIQYFYCYHCSYKSKQKSNLQAHIVRHFKNKDVPFHCYMCDFVTLKRDLIIEHFKTHPKYQSKWNQYDETEYKYRLEICNKRYYSCKKCAFRTYQYVKLKRHDELTHKTEMDDRFFKYRCDKCKYKTFRSNNFKVHKLTHLRPEETQYFYCYHCSCKCNQKSSLKTHIFRHFKRGEIPFHCYMCDFVTLKRDLIIEHFKKHPKHHSKCDEIDYKNELEIPYFYCYHCSHKSDYKHDLKRHIFRHFKNENVPFQCYICDFTTLKRNLIIEHFKKHPKHHSNVTDQIINIDLKLTPKNK